MSKAQSQRRVFFALWPDPAVRKDMDAIAQSNRLAHSRPIRAGNRHATLIFLGNLPEDRLHELHDAAAAVRGRPFTLAMNRIEVWRRSAVQVLCPDTVPDALVKLHSDLDRRLIDAGFETERRAYRPHVTLARKTRVKMELALIDPVLEWPVDAFVLVESVSVRDGVRYDVLQRWQLT